MDAALADLFLRAALANRADAMDGTVAESPEEAAASFLFARLDSLRGGKGRFERDVRLPIPCGPNPWLEVEIWSGRDRLAILLDTPESIADLSRYRLARREDALLQKNGCRVVRLLSCDVSERLDAALDEIARFCPDVSSPASDPALPAVR